MSVVALKNAVVGIINENGNNNDNKNLLNNQSNDNSYGTNTHDDLEHAALPNDILQGSLINKVFGKIDPRVISDLIIGLSDGLTVPFALTAGLSSLGDAKLVITGGFAELISGTISMGLGGYLGAKSESDYYIAEVKNEKKVFYNDPSLVNHQVEDILLDMNPDFTDETILTFIKDLQKNPELMVDFIIRYGKGLEEPDPNRRLISAVTIGGGYFVGGLVPLIPYFFVQSVGTGLLYSIILMVITLFCFGYVKIILSMGDECSLSKKITEGLQMVAVGGIAAGSAWFLVKTLG
ncbi:hypothetical protein Kpol_529p4 [Vanderwaltozyma polyspora DSM 70294]|uniref:Protein CCC1 n=1 Tax=Vanderwaltozyma polyspora (strain ATCC 22028 / DSM 70294 / BCRC 21397 / CBS 2163 / NBRC 10782 / NRRL Y-8283 / UCD 57-17) TaxID=436907 RepID=A7TM57_VANPO|nr:uncharacterized protein Kpol_529p4 [Vanderwaltozyma polyspora DSM 70294]EDO16624.1 hypothetical protein Kpol_529p4 [Vanderwaltozyma polyspora DSM 70294]